jgi:hypothetical protein
MTWGLFFFSQKKQHVFVDRFEKDARVGQSRGKPTSHRKASAFSPCLLHHKPRPVQSPAPTKP